MNPRGMVSRFLLIAPIFMGFECQAAHPSISQVLDDARAARLGAPPMGYAVEILVLSRDNQNVPFPKDAQDKRNYQIYVNQDQINIEGESFRFREGAYRRHVNTRHLWDGERYFSSQTDFNQDEEPEGSLYSVSAQLIRKQRLFFNLGGSAFLEGNSPHYREVGDWISLLASQGSRARMREGTELVDGYPCMVLEADTDFGDFTFWVDPNSGHTVRRWECLLSGDDKLGDIRLSEMRLSGGPDESHVVEMRMAVDSVDIEKIGDAYIPVSGIQVHTGKTSDGRVFQTNMIATRSNIVLAPDTEALNVFVMDYPEDALIRDRDMPFVRWRWSQGRLVAAVDPRTEELIDVAAIEIAKEQPEAPDQLDRTGESSVGAGSETAVSADADTESDMSPGERSGQGSGKWVFLFLAFGVVVAAVMLPRFIHRR